MVILTFFDLCGSEDSDDLPDGSVFLPKPYRGAHMIATLRELTAAA